MYMCVCVCIYICIYSFSHIILFSFFHYKRRNVVKGKLIPFPKVGVINLKMIMNAEIFLEESALEKERRKQWLWVFLSSGLYGWFCLFFFFFFFSSCQRSQGPTSACIESRLSWPGEKKNRLTIENQFNFFSFTCCAAGKHFPVWHVTDGSLSNGQCDVFGRSS